MAKITIIDDDGIARDSLSVFLTRSGHQVSAAADGVNGLLLCKNGEPDLIVLDRDLPGMSGSEVLAGLRQSGCMAKVLILTGYADPADADQYLKAGADAFLAKGEGLTTVLNEIDSLLGITTNKKTPKPLHETWHEPVYGQSKPGLAKILIVDDDYCVCSTLARYLSTAGYAVSVAEDGAAALASVKKVQPDLVLLDINMPQKTGVEVLMELHSGFPEIGVLMITGNEDEAVALSCLKNGAFDYISKPINLASLEITLQARLLLQKKDK